MSKLPSDITKIIHDRQLEIDQVFKANLKANLFKENVVMAKKVKKSKLNFNSASWQNFFKKLNTASGLSVIALLILVGGASALVGSNTAKNNSERKTEIPANLDGVLPVSDIKTKALADAPGATVTNIELENEEGKLVYKVRFSDGSFKLYDAKTGTLVTNISSGVEKDSTVPADFVAGIDLSKARSIAQDKRPGKIINKIELETENGVVVYSVRFTDGGRVDVNAKDGSVVSVRSANSSSQTTTTNSDDDSNDDSRTRTSGSGSGSDDSNDDNSGSSSGSSSSGSDDKSGSNSGSGSGSSGSGSGSHSGDDDKSGHN